PPNKENREENYDDEDCFRPGLDHRRARDRSGVRRQGLPGGPGIRPHQQLRLRWLMCQRMSRKSGNRFSDKDMRKPNQTCPGRNGDAAGAAEAPAGAPIMISSIARWIIVAAAIALHGAVVANGSAAAQSSALRLAGPSGLSNRYDPPVSETDVGRADQQHAGW